MVNIPLSKPCLGEEEKRAVNEVLDSGFLAQGENVRKFEEEFARYVGVKEAVATSNGTTALFVALKALGVKEGDRVITTPFTFVAIRRALFSSVEEYRFFVMWMKKPLILTRESLRIFLKKERNIKGIIAVHLYGLPCDLEEIAFLTQKYNLFLLEDCAQAHGAECQGRKVGSWGDMGAFSFYPTKNMTTGEGGMITTNDSLLAQECRMLINHGSRKRYYHEALGYNFRLTDIGGALGRVQLSKLEQFNEKRRRNAAFYNQELADLPFIDVPYLPPYALPVFHQYTLRVKGARDALLQFLRDRGIGCRNLLSSTSSSPALFAEFIFCLFLSCSRKPGEEVLSLPVHPQLTREDLNTIILGVREFFLNH